jgi:hypothetical protein
MGFLQSAINQVGRDLGRVASNAIFKDRHAIPIRRAPSYHNSQPAQQRQAVRSPKVHHLEEVQSSFKSAIDFKTGYRPTTLISKLGGAFVVIKNEARAFVDDGYLDNQESQQLFAMMKGFNRKCSDVEDVIGFTEDPDSKVYQQLTKIHESAKAIFVEVLEVSAKACLERAQLYDQAAQDIHPLQFGRYIGLHLLWFPKYAKGGEKQTTKAVIANILDVITLTFPITRLVLLIMGLTSFSSEQRQRQQNKDAYTDAAQQERQRAKIYETFVRDNTSK